MSHDPACSYCQSRRTFLGAGLLLGVGLALPGLALAGGFRQFDGEVQINGRKASVRSRVHAGSTITTAGGAASFVIGDNAFLLRPHSQVRFTPRSRSSGLISTLRLVSGGLLSVFGPGPKKLLTPTATIGIRGTGVYLEAQADTSYVCLCYGKVDLSATAAGSTASLLEATRHEARNVGANGGVEPAKMLNHTDEELMMLEGLVGRKVPFL